MGVGMLIVCPAAILVCTAFMRRGQTVAAVAAALMWAQTGVALAICLPCLAAGAQSAPISNGFRLDGIASVFVLLTTLVVACAFTHAIGFFEREEQAGHSVEGRAIREFYLFATLFLLAMYAVVLADNLGFLWIAVEATTLLSAPLVYFHRSHTSLEATWKYLIICSVGIAFAFFGTAILYAASQHTAALPEGTLSLAALVRHARELPGGLLRLGFVFSLLGYGTKAGLFPLHPWLPDAHSEAPAPASAILSGALLNCALVALWRFSNLMAAAGQGDFVRVTLLPMGVVTVLAASLFLLRQRDLKRMLAYSSMENVGLMAVAIALGAGSAFAIQAINHSLVKVALFLLAGNLLQQFGTKNMREIRGVLTTRPAQGALLLLAAIAIAGTPPFGSFLAEWQILAVAADGRHVTTVAVLSVALVIAFVALAVQVGGVVFGDRSAAGEPDPAKPRLGLVAVPAAMLLASLVLGTMLPLAGVALMQGWTR